ncbi:hypothetical protein [Amaricoccus sp.]|uniref:hypothetical protein n=1 Tax=Amaricoccus sp. TaxID=1872485 RepID=UPI00261D6072|nr:hypothetical protein [uncultured Amaricoccus sp.]
MDNASKPAAGPEDVLRADLQVLRGDLDALAADVAGLGRNQARRLKASAEDLIAAGEDKVREVDDSLSMAVRENPVRSIAIAFLAGYVFAAIVR